MSGLRWPTIALFIFASWTVPAFADYDRCDDPLVIDHDKPPPQPEAFISIHREMTELAFVENVCTVEPMNWISVFERYVRDNGCSLQSPIGRSIMAHARKMSQITLSELAGGKLPEEVTRLQFQSLVQDSIDSSGGCAVMTKRYRAFVASSKDRSR